MLGTKLAHYEITRRLGKGGMGEVYQATDARLGRNVAIKLLPMDSTQTEERLKRLEYEARVLASLNHPSIASIYGLEEFEGRKFLVMELVPGETLAERIKRGPIPVGEAIGLGRLIAEALEVAHEKGIIHRDLKPANVMITPDGKLKLLDFGLARIFEPVPDMSGESPTLPSTMSMGNTILGTAAYMSPEQARGKSVDKRTDIWAFGCVLFEMLTARQAFAGETVSDIIAAILSGIPDMAALPKEIPAKIRSLIRKCTEKDLRLRLHDIADARIEIDEAMGGIEAPPIPPPAPTAARKRTAVYVLAALVFAVLLVFAGARFSSVSSTPSATWTGSLLVGGATVAWGPRISPDGRTVSFIVMVDGQTQVALMDAESGSWDVLTKRPESGVRMHSSWSRDGSRIYFTRGSTLGVNVYSIPIVGGEERLVLDNAFCPEPLPDGSLLVIRLKSDNEPQLYRFWPEDGRVESLPVFLGKSLDPLVPIRAFPDGKEAVFFGKTMTANVLDPLPGLHSIDLVSKVTRSLASNLELNADLWPISVDPKLSILSDSPSGDLHRVVAINRTDGISSKVLFTLTGRFAGLDMSGDGTVFVDQQNNTLDVLQIDPSGGPIHRIAKSETYLLKSHTVELPDGRVIVPGIVSGRPKLMLSKTNKLATPLIDTSEETSGPISAVGSNNIAFLIGSGASKAIAIASMSDRRVMRRLSVTNGASIAQLASSPDGARLYYVNERTVWEVPVEGGEPQKIAAASSIAVHPNGKEIFLQRIGTDLSVRLFRKLLPDGAEVEIQISDEVRMGDVPLATNAVNRDGKILVTTALDENTWFWQLSIFDPKTGHAKHIPTDFNGDILYAGWASDGKILAMGVNTEGAIWRFRPQAQ